jgi:predicted dehydrogenase
LTFIGVHRPSLELFGFRLPSALRRPRATGMPSAMSPAPVTRRRFLRQAALASAALSAASATGSPAANAAADGPANTPAPPRTAAIIGHTGRGDYGHGLDTLFTGRPGLTLVALADAHPEGRARAAARLKPARTYADYREMLAREKPALVSVAPRHADQHHDMVLAALQAGAHVVCEKPFTISPAESDALLREADARGLRLAVTHQMRLAPAIVRLKAAIDAGQLGELLEMRAYGKQDNRAGGEDLMVLGTHLFDLMRLFAGDPLSCTARALWKGRDITPADARRVKDDVGPVAGDEISAQFAFARGIHGTFTSRAALRESVGAWGVELIGSKGSARVNANIPPGVFLLQAGTWRPDGRIDAWRPFAADAEPADEAGAFPTANARLVDDWLDAIARRREPICSARNGAWAVEMATGVMRAALTQSRVAFPLADRRHPLAPRA